MVKIQTIAEEHHRRPRSGGGTDTPGNISYVKGTLHRYWHTLFGNKNPRQICRWLNKQCPYKPKGVKIICKFINGSRATVPGKIVDTKKLNVIK